MQFNPDRSEFEMIDICVQGNRSALHIPDRIRLEGTGTTGWDRRYEIKTLIPVDYPLIW
jgi:hypothetical protein